jgi:hypothetical protein
MLWELYHCKTPYKVSRAGGYVPRRGFPFFSTRTPVPLALLATACMNKEPGLRPNFGQVVAELQDLLCHACSPGGTHPGVQDLTQRQQPAAAAGAGEQGLAGDTQQQQQQQQQVGVGQGLMPLRTWQQAQQQPPLQGQGVMTPGEAPSYRLSPAHSMGGTGWAAGTDAVSATTAAAEEEEAAGMAASASGAAVAPVLLQQGGAGRSAGV